MSLSRAERNFRTGLVGTIGALRRPVIEPPSGEIARDPTEESDEHHRLARTIRCAARSKTSRSGSRILGDSAPLGLAAFAVTTFMLSMISAELMKV